MAMFPVDKLRNSWATIRDLRDIVRFVAEMVFLGAMTLVILLGIPYLAHLALTAPGVCK